MINEEMYVLYNISMIKYMKCRVVTDPSHGPMRRLLGAGKKVDEPM